MLRLPSLAVFTLLASACASVPMARPEMDLAAKQFRTTPGKTNLYVFRDESLGAAIKMSRILDGGRRRRRAARFAPPAAPAGRRSGAGGHDRPHGADPHEPARRRRRSRPGRHSSSRPSRRARTLLSRRPSRTRASISRPSPARTFMCSRRVLVAEDGVREEGAARKKGSTSLGTRRARRR
jgi:hypothetical protein